MYWAIAIALMEAHFVLFLEHSLIALDIEIPSLLFGDFWWKVIFFPLSVFLQRKNCCFLFLFAYAFAHDICPWLHFPVLQIDSYQVIHSLSRGFSPRNLAVFTNLLNIVFFFLLFLFIALPSYLISDHEYVKHWS